MPVVRSRGGEQRTASGCWTCRLRRLKCDEGLGNCNQCSRHGIPCAGYGKEKPEWKDGGVREAKKLQRIKSLISRKRKRDRQGNQHRDSRSGKLLILDTSNIIGLPESIYSAQRSSSDTDINIPGPVFDTQLEGPDFSSLHFSPLATKSPEKQVATPSSAREDELLMHYLDFVFTLQFRHHKYAANFSSRSWLFSLVKRIRPLQCSVLSLSALHQYHLHRLGILGRAHDDTLQELQDHHAATLSELRQFIREQTSDSLANNHVPILACCVQLISFDLCQGGNTEWRMHLQAANTLIKNHVEFIGPGSPSEYRFHQDVASNFCTGAIVWFDILSSATTGKKPFLYTDHQRLLKSQTPLVNLENIMGCENSVMILIGEISVLQEWKSDNQVKGKLNVWLLVEKAKWILEALQREIERVEVALNGHTGPAIGEDSDPGKDYEIYMTTNIFACGAIVYLHTVVCGFYPSLPEIRIGVEQTILAMKRIKECDIGSLARTLVWPAVIAGCLADDTQSEFFRRFLSAGSDNAYGFGNCHIAKDVLEMCWETTRKSRVSNSGTAEVCDWSRAMKYLEYEVLLV